MSSSAQLQQPAGPPARSGSRFMLAVVTGALLLTALAGVLGETAAGAGRTLSPGEAAADAQARAEMVAMGWQVPASASLRGLSTSLQQSHGVEILHVERSFRLELDDRTVSAGVASDRQRAVATVLLADELALYPAGFLRASGLRRVALCAGLHENRRAIPSLPNYRNTLLLDVQGTSSFLRRLIHHEVFHFADLADDGQVLSDPAWEALNPAGFVYGHGGRDMREPGSSALTDDRPGFLTRYATSALEEDKAEVFAFLMAEPAEVDRRASDDHLLAAKVVQVRDIASGLDPDMDGSFWARIARQRSR